MHNLFLTDTVNEQIHIMKPGTSSLTLTQRCTTKAKLRSAAQHSERHWQAQSVQTSTSLHWTSFHAEKRFFLLFFFFNVVAGITETFIILNTSLLASGTATRTLAVCPTYLSRNTSHKVSFSCHCYISDTQQDSLDAHRQSVEMLRPLIHRNHKRKNVKMSFWIAHRSKLNKLNVGRCFCSDVCTFLLYCRYVLGSLQLWLLRENLYLVTLCWIYKKNKLPDGWRKITHVSVMSIYGE